MKVLCLIITLIIIIRGLKGMFTKKSSISIRYNPIPIYPTIEEPTTRITQPVSELVKQSSMVPEWKTPPYGYSKPNQLEERKLRGNIKRLFAFKNDKGAHAIHKMRMKHPHATELEILRLVDIEYRIKRG